MGLKEKRTLVITTVLCAGWFAAAVIMYRTGADGGMLFYGIAVLINVILNLGLSTKTVTVYGAKKLVLLGKWIMPVTGAVCLLINSYSQQFWQQNMDEAVYIYVGILFVVSANYFPKNHINPYAGLKFPWLFHKEEGWYKTHKLGSYTWLLSGAVMMLHPFHKLTIVTVTLVVVLAGAVPLIYSLTFCFPKKKKMDQEG